MDVSGVLRSAGYRREDVRVGGLAAALTLIGVTVLGVGVPTQMEWVTVDQLFERPAVDGTIPLTLVGFVAVVSLSAAVAVIVIERRLPWPLGKRIARRKPTSRLYLPNALGFLAGFVSMQITREALPTATGVYSSLRSDGMLLDVTAPADFAYSAVIGIAAWLAGWAMGLLLVVIWRSRPRGEPERRDQSAAARPSAG